MSDKRGILMLKIIPIRALQDNYIWLVVHQQECFIVDPGEASPVFDFIRQHHLTLTAILVTHKHWDHTNGIKKLLQYDKNIAVYAHSLENMSATTHVVEHDDMISINDWIKMKVIHIPGHTLGHVAYHAKDIVFSGDTLFSAGCGRIFEGTAEQMFASLNQLAALPDDTLIYCGHEYTLKNLQFALQVEPDNVFIHERIQHIKRLLADNKPSLPVSIAIEKQTNPFLRCAVKSVISSVEAHINRKLERAVDVFRELREWKNKF